MQAFVAGMHQNRYRQLQLFDDVQLLARFQVVTLYQRETVIGYIAVFHSAAIQRVEPDPRPGFFVVIPKHPGNVPVFFHAIDKALGRVRIGPGIGRTHSSVFPPERLHHKPDFFVRAEQRFQVTDRFVCRVPVLRLPDLFFFDIGLIHNHGFVIDGSVPLQRFVFHFGTRQPSVRLGQIGNDGSGHVPHAALKTLPFPGTLTWFIPFWVRPAPRVPHIAAVALMFQGHAYIDPLLVFQPGAVDVGQ